MTVQLWCLLAGCVLPYVWAGASLPFRNKQLGEVDVRQPRLQAADLTAGGAGAWGAQMNAWEALGVFTAANVAAYIAGVSPEGTWAMLAIVWVTARIAHGVFYVLEQAALRVLSFVVGMVSSVWIFVLALSA
jgi:uncharacterized MAPEG superfamily protein